MKLASPILPITLPPPHEPALTFFHSKPFIQFQSTFHPPNFSFFFSTFLHLPSSSIDHHLPSSPHSSNPTTPVDIATRDTGLQGGDLRHMTRQEQFEELLRRHVMVLQRFKQLGINDREDQLTFRRSYSLQRHPYVVHTSFRFPMSHAIFVSIYLFVFYWGNYCPFFPSSKKFYISFINSKI